MTTVQISNTYLSTPLKPRQAQEKVREILYDFLDHTDADSGFNTELFIEEVTADEDGGFVIVEEEAVGSADVEFDDDKLDDLISDYLEYSETAGADDLVGEDDVRDEAEEEPDFDFATDDDAEESEY